MWSRSFDTNTLSVQSSCPISAKWFKNHSQRLLKSSTAASCITCCTIMSRCSIISCMISLCSCYSSAMARKNQGTSRTSRQQRPKKQPNHASPPNHPNVYQFLDTMPGTVQNDHRCSVVSKRKGSPAGSCLLFPPLSTRVQQSDKIATSKRWFVARRKKQTCMHVFCKCCT